MERNSSVPWFAIGLLLGAVAGLAAGLLAAPKTGQENRDPGQRAAWCTPRAAREAALC